MWEKCNRYMELYLQLVLSHNVGVVTQTGSSASAAGAFKKESISAVR